MRPDAECRLVRPSLSQVSFVEGVKPESRPPVGEVISPEQFGLVYMLALDESKLGVQSNLVIWLKQTLVVEDASDCRLHVLEHAAQTTRTRD